MKALMALGLLLFSIGLFAQQHLIRYDLAGENVSYFKIKKPGDTVAVSVIPISKTKRVNLQLVNAAGSYRHRVVYINREETPESVVIPGLGAAPSSKLVNGLAAIDEDLLKSVVTKQDGDNKGIGNFESAQQKAAKQLFAKQYNALAAAMSQYKSAVMFSKNCELLWKDLAVLRYTIQTPATEVKKAANQKVSAVFPGAADNPSLILLNNSDENLKAAFSAVKEKYASLLSVYNSFAGLDIESATADSLMKKAEGSAVQLNNAVKSTAVPDDLVNRIADLLRQIQDDNYTRLSPMDINRKTIMAEIEFIPLIDSVTAGAVQLNSRDTIRRYVPVYKKEPLRFRNTYGFSFVTYAENRWHYFVRPDSVIARESADQFQPVVVTFLHFYAPRDKGFRWGGTFGAGIPVGGDNSKLNIMMGLSTFLGKNDPVCISAGFAGTQVKKLSGWQTGDKVGFAALGANDYSTVYRLGYFFSLTFNPGTLNLKD